MIDLSLEQEIRYPSEWEITIITLDVWSVKVWTHWLVVKSQIFIVWSKLPEAITLSLIIHKVLTELKCPIKTSIILSLSQILIVLSLLPDKI